MKHRSGKADSETQERKLRRMSSPSCIQTLSCSWANWGRRRLACCISRAAHITKLAERRCWPQGLSTVVGDFCQFVAVSKRRHSSSTMGQRNSQLLPPNVAVADGRLSEVGAHNRLAFRSRKLHFSTGDEPAELCVAKRMPPSTQSAEDLRPSGVPAVATANLSHDIIISNLNGHCSTQTNVLLASLESGHQITAASSSTLTHGNSVTSVTYSTSVHPTVQQEQFSFHRTHSLEQKQQYKHCKRSPTSADQEHNLDQDQSTLGMSNVSHLGASHVSTSISSNNHQAIAWPQQQQNYSLPNTSIFSHRSPIVSSQMTQKQQQATAPSMYGTTAAQHLLHNSHSTYQHGVVARRSPFMKAKTIDVHQPHVRLNEAEHIRKYSDTATVIRHQLLTANTPNMFPTATEHPLNNALSGTQQCSTSGSVRPVTHQGQLVAALLSADQAQRARRSMSPKLSPYNLSPRSLSPAGRATSCSMVTSARCSVTLQQHTVVAPRERRSLAVNDLDTALNQLTCRQRDSAAATSTTMNNHVPRIMISGERGRHMSAGAVEAVNHHLKRLDGVRSEVNSPVNLFSDPTHSKSDTSLLFTAGLEAPTMGTSSIINTSPSSSPCVNSEQPKVGMSPTCESASPERVWSPEQRPSSNLQQRSQRGRFLPRAMTVDCEAPTDRPTFLTNALGRPTSILDNVRWPSHVPEQLQANLQSTFQGKPTYLFYQKSLNWQSWWWAEPISEDLKVIAED